jgi:hypothetical protein
LRSAFLISCLPGIFMLPSSKRPVRRLAVGDSTRRTVLF